MAGFKTAVLVEGYRSVVEDRAAVLPAGEQLVAVVADGAGGRSGAAEAAEMVVQSVRRLVAAPPPAADPFSWCRFLAELDRAIMQDPEAGETTAVVVSIGLPGMVGASVGDSGAWLITPRDYRDLTAHQQRKPGLGTGLAVPIPFAATLPPDGTLLVASDGLLKYTSAEAICAAVREGDVAAAVGWLVDLVRLRSGKLQDDVAVILCRPAAGPSGSAGSS